MNDVNSERVAPIRTEVIDETRSEVRARDAVACSTEAFPRPGVGGGRLGQRGSLDADAGKL